MQKTIYLLFLFCSSMAIAQKPILKAKIELDSAWRNYLFIAKISSHSDFYSLHSSIIVDSVSIDRNGKVQLKKLKSGNGLYRISVVKYNDAAAHLYTRTCPNYAFVYLDTNTTLNFTAKSNNFYLTFDTKKKGINADLLAIRDYNKPVINKVIQILQSQDSNQIKNFKVTLFPLLEDRNQQLQPFIDNTKFDYVRFMGLAEYNFDKLFRDTAFFAKQINKLPKTNELFLNFANEFASARQAKNQLVSKKAPNFNLIDQQNTAVEFYKHSNKLIILHFWASWCAPCRTEITNILIPFYAKYQAKNLTIISISLDTKAENWKKAMSQLNMTWSNQWLAVKGLEDEVCQKYAVQSLPALFIIDENFNILKAFANEYELLTFTEAYFNNK